MEHWKDNNLSAIMEYPFDYDRYLETQLRRISDLDERKFAKELLIDGLGNAIRSIEEKYRQLERRVYEELEIADNQYEIVTTIAERSHYDPTNPTLYPVSEEDLTEAPTVPPLSEDGRIRIATIYLEAGEEIQEKFKEAARFTAMLRSNPQGGGQGGESKEPKDSQGAKEIEVYAEPSKRYRDAVETLYQIFQDNHVPWETVNMGHLDKFYDICIDEEEWDGRPISADEAEIDFGTFKEYVRHDVIPLWNLEWRRFDSEDFMVPCINGIYYEHEYLPEDKAEKDGYLVRANEDILEIRHERDRIVIKSLIKTFEAWKALRLIQRETVRSLDYNAPLLTNRKRDSFFRRLASNSRIQLMTKADLFRRIMELDIRDYIEVTGYEICENAEDYPRVEGMNWFVKDELFPMETRKVLLLKFKEKQPGHYLNGSMVRFAVSQTQLETAEYRCVGILEEPGTKDAAMEKKEAGE